jgi:hypothetical protein
VYQERKNWKKRRGDIQLMFFGLQVTELATSSSLNNGGLLFNTRNTDVAVSSWLMNLSLMSQLWLSFVRIV